MIDEATLKTIDRLIVTTELLIKNNQEQQKIIDLQHKIVNLLVKDRIKQHLPTKEAAKFLNVSHQTLERWRDEHDHPLKFTKRGGRYYYSVEDLVNYLNEKQN